MSPTATAATPTVPTRPARTETPRPTLAGRGVRLPLGVYVASRVLVVVTALVATVVRGEDPGAGPWPALEHGPGLVRALTRWDGAWYLDIARHGYPAAPTVHHGLSRYAFFPLVPGLVKIIATVTFLPYGVAGLLLSFVVGGVAVYAVWRLVDDLAGREAAHRAACLVALFPGAFALTFVYSEGALIAGAAGCLLALRRRAWVIAGLCGAVATASRPTGIVIVAACAVAAFQARERRAVLAPLIASAGVVAYATYSRLHGGHWTLWLTSEREAWGDRADFGREAVKRLWTVLVHGPHLGTGDLALNDFVGALGLVALVAMLVCLWRWRPPAPIALYALGASAMAIVSNHVGPRPRMLLAAFPLVAATGVVARGRVFAAIVAVSAVGLVAVTALLMTTQAFTP